MLPEPLFRAFGKDIHSIVERVKGVEWSSSCPRCGDYAHVGSDEPDRFSMWFDDKPRGWCRRCNYFAFADSITGRRQMTAAEIKEMEEERLRRAKAEMDRQRKMIERLQAEARWEVWHQKMTDEQFEHWRRQGINDDSIYEYHLGYAQDQTFSVKGVEFFETDTLTIPHWDDCGVVNVQHRLLDPPSPSDKYRQQPGLMSAMFMTDRFDTLTGDVIVVEGAKKAMVVKQQIGLAQFSIVALPSKYPSKAMLSKLDDASAVFLCLDPDAYIGGRDRKGKIISPQVERIADSLGNERTRLVTLPVKPDDLFTMYGGTPSDFMRFVNQSHRRFK